MLNGKKIISLFLVLTVFVTSIGFPAQILSASQNHNFTGNGFNVDFAVSSSWNNGYGGSLTITNTGEQPIEDWLLIANTNLGLGEWGASGGRILSQDDSQTIITHQDWNYVIPVGGSITLWLNGSHAGSTPIPTNYILRGTGWTSEETNVGGQQIVRRLVPESEYSFEIWVHEVTDTHFNQAIGLVNNSGRIIHDWEVVFDLPDGAAVQNTINAQFTQTNNQSSNNQVSLTRAIGGGQQWYPDMHLRLEVLGGFDSGIISSATISNLAVYEKVLDEDNVNTDDMPSIVVLTPFPNGRVTNSFVDIEYLATPSEGERIVEIYYSINVSVK